MSFRFPFKTLLAVSLLSYVLVDYPPLKIRYVTDGQDLKKAEFYPLSSFPMYATFSDNPYHVYVTTAAGEPVALTTTLRAHASVLKKTYEQELKAQKKKVRDGAPDIGRPEMKRIAGELTLRLLKEQPGTIEWIKTLPNPKLRLHEVVLTSGDDGIQREDTMVAEL